MAHRSRLVGFIIDREAGDLDVAADFWSGGESYYGDENVNDGATH